MGGQNIPRKVQLNVARKFVQHLQTLTRKPETRSTLRQLYLETFRPLLDNPDEKRLNFSSLLFCMRGARWIVISRADREIITYKNLARNSEGQSQSRREESGNERISGSNVEQPQTLNSKSKSRKRTRKKMKQNNCVENGFVDFAELRRKLDSQRHHLAKDKGGIIIFPASDKDGVIDMGSLDISELRSFPLHVRNMSDRTYSFGYVVLGSGSDFSIDNGNDEVVSKKMENKLAGYEYASVQVEISAGNPGIFHMTVAFWFRCGKGKPFHIVKFIKAEVTNDLVKDLQPVAPYEKPKFVLRSSTPASELVRGKGPPFEKMHFSVKLKSYDIPEKLRLEAEKKNLSAYLSLIFHGQLVPAHNHCSRYSNLLYAEEMQMENDIQRYNMEKAKLRQVPKQSYIALSVPGLAEKRPSLVCGDRLYVHKLRPDGSEEKKAYEGYVHRVQLDEVHLMFCKEFHDSFADNMLVSVQFTFSRTPMKLMHRALEMAAGFLQQLPSAGSSPNSVPTVGKRKRLCMVSETKLQSWLKILTPLRVLTPHRMIQKSQLVQPLFPTSVLKYGRQLYGDHDSFYDQNIGSNKEQTQAVENILSGTSRPYPYLIFGPPGSGKTVTLVEAIKQVLDKCSESRVLACAPSNSAADLILERVAPHNVVPNTQMLRLNAYGRDVSSVPPGIMKFSKRSNTGFFSFPSKDDIKTKYRLVVTTLVTTGRLVSMGIGNSHFTHVFIDEAGHGMEPECLIPIAGLLRIDRNIGGQLVLAGDPKQLGPVLRSPEAISFGLNVSLLERLMGPQFPSFNRQAGSGSNNIGAYNEKLVTKLLNNYRSHPAIIKIPNELFYDNELRVCANQVLRESLCQWSGLRTKGFPVMFEGVCGKDQREEKSPSFFNPQEVSVVLRYVKDLKEARGVSVKTEDIGIISPYHRQVQKIRQSLDKKLHIRDIKVGSVEEFQGQERKVIIISTVRSSEEFLHLDAVHKLGFLRNPKRFNVAVTRAKALLVVIGNPHVLCRDEYWRKFIQYCLNKDSYQGCAFEMPDIVDETLASQLADIELNDDSAFFADEHLPSTEYEDQEWKPGDL